MVAYQPAKTATPLDGTTDLYFAQPQREQGRSAALETMWPRVALADIVDLRLSSVDKKTRPEEEKVRLCNYIDVYNHNAIRADMDFMKATASEREIQKCRLEVNDVVITKDSEKHDDIGVPALVWEDIANLVCGYHLAILRPLRTVLDGGFLFYALGAHEVKRQFQSYANGITRFGLRRGDIGLVKIRLPPIAEQRKIAAILSSVDDTIDKTQAVIDQVQVVKRGLIQELLTRGMPGRHMRFKQTEIGEIPEGWAIVRIIDVADVDYGISAAVSANTDPYIGWPILTGANLTLDGRIDLSKLVYHKPPSKERFYLRKNDLLLNWRSGSPKHVGKTVLFDLDGNYTYASFVLRIRSRGKLVPGFGHVLLNFMRDAEFFSKDLSQQVNFKMNAAVFREVLIRLPSVDEQAEIALTVARIDSRLAGEAELLAGLQNVKSALMSVLLTGELRVTPDTEAA